MMNSEVITDGSSLNILSWQYLRATESYSSMLPVVEVYFEIKGTLYGNKNTCKSLKKYSVSYYDMYDGKMLYLLTQDSLWKRKHHPFMVCACQRCEGV